MARRTKKVGSTGRFGPRYGLNVRRRVKAIEEGQFRKHACPRCLTGRLKRDATAIWHCRKCDHKFAGGAYVPTSGKRERGQGVKVAADETALEAAQEALAEAEEEEEQTEAPVDLTEPELPEDGADDGDEVDEDRPTLPEA